MTNYAAVDAPSAPSPAPHATFSSFAEAVRRRPGLLALIVAYLFAAASARTPLTVAVALLMLAVFALRVRCRTRHCAKTRLSDPTSP
jgi:hypothetical protein